MSKFFLILVTVFFLFGCGTETGTGYTGGPTGEAAVTLKNAAFSTSFSAIHLNRFFSVVNPITNFKFCIRKVKFENESGTEIQKNGVSNLEMEIGLIDVSNGAAKTWGNPTLPVGFTMSRMKVVVEKDEDLCGIPDAIQFNAYGSQDNVEMVWDFDPAVAVSASDVLLLSMSTLADALQDAETAGDLTDETLRTYVQQTINSGSEQ